MVKIIADSTCDLPKDILEEYGVSILPLHIICNEADYLDGDTITPQEIFAWADENKTTPKTSAVSPGEAVELLKPYADAGRDVVCIAISDAFSTTGNVLRMTADAINEEAGRTQVHVINSANLSTGIGLLVLEAATMAKEGMKAEQIVENIEALIPKVRASFVVDTLTYLHRGGRCSGLAALAGGALKLHPQIVVKDGKMDVAKKYRGNMKKVLLEYTKELTDALMHAGKNRVFITHSGCDKEVVDSIREYITGLGIFEEILETTAGGVISSHCGPGTLGVLFIEE
ncbi:MAG: DegV family protein [Lachnospiraceae bacterium]|nr:DegV family protein [Lachnospiraceae bacterium]